MRPVYVRTVDDMQLHTFMAEEYLYVAHQLPKVIKHLEEYLVEEVYQTEKEELIKYTKNLL
jgi:hypothetical protein